MPADEPTVVFTDGACQGNPGPGGWAWAVPGGRWRSGYEPATTNQRMELAAVLDAVTTLRGRLEVVSDSTYVVNCFQKRWWEGWERRGWKNAQRQDVANQDLWRPLVDAYHRRDGGMRFRWVKGHSGDPGNDLVDRLAVAAAASRRGAEGDRPPADPGPADRAVRGSVGRGVGRPQPDPAAAAPGDAGAAGARCLVTGARPPELGGWDDTTVADRVRAKLTEILAAKRAVDPSLAVLTGLDLGAEQLGAEAARTAGVPYETGVAFDGQDRRWPAASRGRYAELLAASRAVTVLAASPPRGREDLARCLGAQQVWLAERATEALVVWDGTDRWTGRRVEDLRRRVGDDDVWVLDPAAL